MTDADKQSYEFMAEFREDPQNDNLFPWVAARLGYLRGLADGRKESLKTKQHVISNYPFAALTDYDQLRAELTEQCRINGIGQQRELKLMSELAEAKAAFKDLQDSINEHNQKCPNGLLIDEMEKLKSDLEETNKNCISLSLHESRMEEVRTELAEAKAANGLLNKQYAPLVKSNKEDNKIIDQLETEIEKLKAERNE